MCFILAPTVPVGAFPAAPAARGVWLFIKDSSLPKQAAERQEWHSTAERWNEYRKSYPFKPDIAIPLTS